LAFRDIFALFFLRVRFAEARLPLEAEPAPGGGCTDGSTLAPARIAEHGLSLGIR
jgi:hypothetical protein